MASHVRPLAAILALLIVPLAAGRANITSASPHWADHAEVAVWIDSAGAPPFAAALVERALAVWTTASGGHVTLARARARAAAPIDVVFVTSDTVYGETVPHIDAGSGLITRAGVAINTELPPDPIDARIVVYLTALHELGHALGLPHSDTFAAIMYRFRQPDDGPRFFGAFRSLLRSADDIGTPRATGLSAEDVDRLRALYSR